MKKFLLCLAVLPLTALGQQCVLQDKTVTSGSLVITERTELVAEVVPTTIGRRKCLVRFQAKVGAEWHAAFGEQEWDGARPREEACGIAVKRAEDNLRDRIARSQVITERVLICNDSPDLLTLKQTNPGTIGNLAQFRPHPERPREFWHNGAPCRYFLDSNYVNNDIKTFEGIICKIHDSKWVVVDKF
jgi:hypothetical protein